MGIAPHVVLIGLPGVGKSSVGRAVARRSGRPFVDLDTMIERASGKSVARIFEENGETAFRTAEIQVSRDLVGTPPAVVAPGGGWIINPEAVAHLRSSSRIIYLRVTPDEALRRMGRGVERRPLLASGDPGATIRKLYEVRRAHYESRADLTVETTGISRRTVIARVLALVLAIEPDPTDLLPESE